MENQPPKERFKLRNYLRRNFYMPLLLSFNKIFIINPLPKTTGKKYQMGGLFYFQTRTHFLWKHEDSHIKWMLKCTCITDTPFIKILCIYMCNIYKNFRQHNLCLYLYTYTRYNVYTPFKYHPWSTFKNILSNVPPSIRDMN